MTIYIIQGRYTEQAIKGMVAKPEDRASEAAKLAEASGTKMLNYFVTFGEYDFLVIMEGDDNVATMSALFAAASKGGVTDLRTTVAVTTRDARAAMEKAGAIARKYRAAGS